jgi:uncharacterized protein YabE (DUF348 family)
MEARITFNLESPEDYRAFQLYGQIDAMSSVLFEITHNLKKKISYSIDGDSDVLDVVFKKIHDLMEESGVDIDKLG